MPAQRLHHSPSLSLPLLRLWEARRRAEEARLPRSHPHPGTPKSVHPDASAASPPPSLPLPPSPPSLGSTATRRGSSASPIVPTPRHTQVFRFLGRNRLGNRHTISDILLRRSSRSPIAQFQKMSRYFQNIAILSIISRYFDENHTDTYLNIHSPKNRYYRRYFADNIDI
ncbi:uncharacterized protein LOC126593083 [Malus sylvestris]|uniref:uncharacterized protein LOC126593083 n=1 Tax=Malus sylvestris TaxID=3752 RepID=UPI0021ACB72F|nr:uncharacterized protein LOC126593083 [Malus sylvestris]